MLTNTTIKEEDLHALARRRSGDDASSSVDPGSLAPEKNGKLKNSRVEFKLK